MRLSNISEVSNRREFIKKTGGVAAGAAMGDPTKLLGAVSKAGTSSLASAIALYNKLGIDDESIDDLVMELISGTNRLDTMYKDGKVNIGTYEDEDGKWVPKEIVTGYLAMLKKQNPVELLSLVTGDDPYGLDQVTGGMFGSMLDSVCKQFGPKKVVETLMGYSGNSWDGFAAHIGSVLERSNTMHQFFKSIGINPENWENIRFGSLSGINALKKAGIKVPPTMEKEVADTINDIRKQKEERYNDEKPIKPERIQIPNNYKTDSPMHQSFENKLMRALFII